MTRARSMPARRSAPPPPAAIVGRPIEFDPAEAVRASMLTFWSKGYEATSLRDLLGATHLSRSSLYQAFGGKRGLFELCIVDYTDELVAQLGDRLRASASGLGFIRSVLREAVTEGDRSAKPAVASS